MNNLNLIVDEKIYRQFKGSDWPKFENFIAGDYVVNEKINSEIKEFIARMEERYKNLTFENTNELSLSNQQRQKQIFYNKKYKGPDTCRIPWETLGINANGNVFICQSPSWVPIFIGNIKDCDNIYEILNNNQAKKIRQEILNGRYFYCNSTICAFFQRKSKISYNQTHTQEDEIPGTIEDNVDLYVNQIPYELIFDFDYSCNYKCPSCRTEFLNYNNHSIIRSVNNILAEKIKRLIIDKIDNQPIKIRWCGGEPFLSEVYIDLFEYIISKNKKNIKNIIQTNGSLLIAKKNLIEKFLPYVQDLRISFDAGCEETYKITRIGGQWQNLLDNVKFVQNLIHAKKLDTKVFADFVVQKNNYQDLPQFVELCKSLQINFNIQKMWNWGTWDDNIFEEMNVYNVDHPLYEDVKKHFMLAKLPMAKN